MTTRRFSSRPARPSSKRDYVLVAVALVASGAGAALGHSVGAAGFFVTLLFSLFLVRFLFRFIHCVHHSTAHLLP